MNWLDWVLITLFALAAFKGFQRGFIIEFSSLLALVLGIWAGVHLSERVGAAIGLGKDSATIAFVVTVIAVLVLVHVLARGLTQLIDIAQLGIPNKLAGVGFGVLRSAFTLSILFNLIAGWSNDGIPPERVREGSELYGPVVAFAPFVIPALGETKWVSESLRRLKEEAQDLVE